jgi:hypothetical protein
LCCGQSAFPNQPTTPSSLSLRRLSASPTSGGTGCGASRSGGSRRRRPRATRCLRSSTPRTTPKGLRSAKDSRPRLTGSTSRCRAMRSAALCTGYSTSLSGHGCSESGCPNSVARGSCLQLPRPRSPRSCSRTRRSRAASATRHRPCRRPGPAPPSGQGEKEIGQGGE